MRHTCLDPHELVRPGSLLCWENRGRGGKERAGREFDSYFLISRTFVKFKYFETTISLVISLKQVKYENN